MKQFEYSRIDLINNTKEQEAEFLKIAGKDGWELCSVVRLVTGGNMWHSEETKKQYYFKREII